MKLKEFEGKELLRESFFNLPHSVLIKPKESSHEMLLKLETLNFPVVLKAQVFSNGRGKNGGIVMVESLNNCESEIRELFNKTVCDEVVEEILVEEKAIIENEYYLGILFDTQQKCPIIMLSQFGGVDVESIPKDKMICAPVSILEEFMPYHAREIAIKAGFKEKNIILVASEIVRLYRCFRKNDMKMIEINPLIKDTNSKMIALDCVCVLDDDSLKRHNFTFPKRTDTKEKTPMEIEANEIDENDHRGVCGRTFIELDGNIGILSSGGGASVTAIDAVLLDGGKPANFTEYSGNPPAEKVRKLTQVLLKKEGLKGLFIVGGRANFTRIDITLKAIIEVIIEEKFMYPIVIRRAGPGYEDAFEYVKEMRNTHQLNIVLHDDTVPISKAAQEIVQLVQEVSE